MRCAGAGAVIEEGRDDAGDEILVEQVPAPHRHPPAPIRRPDAELADSWTDGLLFALGGPIYAGTNEIQRNIIAERLLGLPRK